MTIGPNSRSSLLTLFLLTIACTACSSNSEKPTPPPPGVTIATVVQRDVPVYQEWVGTMLGNVTADIKPKVEGFLLTRLYTEGSFIKKGQPMFQLDTRQAQASVEQAQAQLETAQAVLAQSQIDVNRYTPLVAERAVSQAELDKANSMRTAAEARVEGDKAAVDNSKLNLGWTRVVSPISGVSSIAKANVGDLITPNTVMATVSAVDPIYVDFGVSEQDYLRMSRAKTGQTAGRDLELLLGDGTMFPQHGHALLVNNEVDSRTGTIQVRATFPNPGNLLRPGQYARIRAVTENRRKALLVPQRAISELQGVYQVGVVSSDNKVAIRAVKPGPLFGDMWVIESGLQPGDRVVVDGLQRLRDGMTVAPTPFKDTQTDAVKGGV